jgi:prepilin-type N-terminal cleavage/methylation domain-containing protein
MRLVRGKRVGVRRGLSLMEVLAALAIFVFAASALTQMTEIASNSAMRARRLTKAQLLAETKMDEVVAGVLPLSSQNGAITEELEGWSFDIAVIPEDWSAVQDGSSGSTVNGLNSVIVTVTFQLPGGTTALVEYSLARLILDPSLRQPVPLPQPAQASPAPK